MSSNILHISRMIPTREPVVEENLPEAVLATPGGLVSDAATFNLLLAHGTTVCLQADPQDRMSRMRAQPDLRPMATTSQEALLAIGKCNMMHVTSSLFGDFDETPGWDALRAALKREGRLHLETC